jgi:hypothetical protein
MEIFLDILIFSITLGIFTFLTINIIKDIKLKNTKTKRYSINLLLIFLVLLFFISFLLDKSYNKFGIMHLSIILFSLIFPVYLRLLITRKKYHRLFFLVSSIFFGIIIITRAFMASTIYQMFPFNIFSLCYVFIVIRPFFKSKLLDNYIFVFGIFSGIFNSITSYYYGSNLDTLPVIINIIVNNFLFIYSIYILISNDFVVSLKLSYINVTWMSIAYFLFLIPNDVFLFNYFYNVRYSNPLLSFYSLFPTIFIPIFNLNIEFNPLYTVVVISSTYILTYVLIKIEEVIDGFIPLRKYLVD